MMFSRRDCFKSLAAVAAAAGVGVRWAVQAERYGPMTVQRHMAYARSGVHLHVFHKGRDVTTSCHFADDTGEGYADVFLRDENGNIYLDKTTGRPAEQRLYGITLRKGAKV